MVESEESNPWNEIKDTVPAPLLPVACAADLISHMYRIEFNYIYDIDKVLLLVLVNLYNKIGWDSKDWEHDIELMGKKGKDEWNNN